MAASGRPVENLRDEATCSICLEYFKDPVTIPECGHNFCRSCLILFWGESEAEASCPQCRKTVQRRSLIPNRQPANLEELIENLSLQEGKEEGGKGEVCEKHQEPLKLFCKEDEAPICLVCDRSKEHKHDKVIPLEEASKEYKEKICRRLEILRKEREEILAYLAALDKESKDLLKLRETEMMEAVEKFRELHKLLEEKVKRLLNDVKEVKKIAERMDEQLDRLFRNLSSLERIIQEMEEKSQQPASELPQKLTETERLKTVEKFRELRRFLEEQEKRLLNNVEEVEKEIARRRDEQLARLSSLERIIQEMEEKRQQPASELLQDVRSTLQRYEKRESPEKPLPFPPELRNRIFESWDLNHLAEDAMKQLKDAVLYRKQIQKANVTLDPDTAHPELILSKDGKSVRVGDKPQALPDNPERFSHEFCVLGRERFTAGRHFWEVTVESGEEWFVGVARKSVGRKDYSNLTPTRGIWAVCHFEGKYWAWTSLFPSLLSPSEKPRRIRVTLDYEGGRVSFYDADSGAKLYTFPGASFSGETLLPYFRLRGNETHLRIS